MGKTAFLFPGQGSQSVGMGRDFQATSRRAATVFASADEVLGFALSRVCFEGPAAELERTDIQQPAIFVTSVAIWEAMLEQGLPDSILGAAAGLSLGEYTALHVAGAFGFEDALKLVAERGRLMQAAALATPSGMVSIVGADEETAQALCEKAAQGEVLVPANYNCPGQTVISGAKTACRRAVELSSEFNCRALALKVAGAFHSPLMASAGERLASPLSGTPLTRPLVPVVANVSAEYHVSAEQIRDALQRQVTQPVLWTRSIGRLIADGYDRFVEIGPGRVLTGLLRKINRQVEALNVSKVADIEAQLSASTAN
ncbi:MAG: ACP S-malonyltransferase [Planctomycetota bacterium]|jgi:[acyl-carrier-protein] S-malonyltransferase